MSRRKPFGIRQWMATKRKSGTPLSAKELLDSAARLHARAEELHSKVHEVHLLADNALAQAAERRKDNEKQNGNRDGSSRTAEKAGCGASAKKKRSPTR